MNLVQELLKKPGYLKCGPNKIAEVFNVSYKQALKALEEAKRTNKNVVYIPALKEEKVDSEYQEFLEWKSLNKKEKI